MEETISKKKKERLFDERARADAWDLMLPTMLFGFGLAFEILAVLLHASEDGVGWFSPVAILLVTIGAWCFLGMISQAKVLAVKQCLVVAEKFEIALTTWQVRELESNFNSGSVFASFVEMIEQAKPEFVPEGAFIGSGGEKSEEACRRLVEHLWNSASPQEAAAEAKPETAQAGSG